MKTVSLSNVLTLAAAVALVAWARPHAAHTVAAVAERSDSYALPPTSVLPAVSMGYRSALADYLWADVMVTQGLRMRERRPFDYVASYLEAIRTLDPMFRDPYRLADTLVAYQSNDPNKVENIRVARKFMEEGLKQFPTDTDLWLDYGQFLSFVGPSVITDPEEQRQWRLDGAIALGRVAELGASDPNAVFKSLAGLHFLVANGENETAIRMLEKAYAITDDPDTRDQIEARLKLLLGKRAESQRVAVAKRFEEVWRDDLPFVSRIDVSIIGPHVDIWRCAGLAASGSSKTGCFRDWNAWATHALSELGGTSQLP